MSKNACLQGHFCEAVNITAAHSAEMGASPCSLQSKLLCRYYTLIWQYYQRYYINKGVCKVKRKLKKAVAAICALTVLSGVGVCAAADNKTSVKKIEILDTTGANILNTYTDTNANITLDPSNLMQVTIKLSDAADNAVNGGQVTFLSSKDVQALDNTNIQYIDQKTSSAENGTVTVRFRPRATVGQGAFVARAGGENVTELASFTYTVQEAAKAMTLNGVNASVVKDSGVAATFTLVANPLPAADKITVTVDDTKTTDYTYDATTGAFAITNASAYPVGDNHNVTISADGYIAASAAFAVTEPEVVIQPGDEKLVEDALDTITATPSAEGTSVTLPATVTEKNYPVTYALASENNNVSLTGNTLTLTGSAFAARATVTAKVGTMEMQKTVYIVPTGKTVSFGNIGLFTNGEGEDAFTNDPDFEAVLGGDNAEELKRERAVALSLALNKVEKDNLNGRLPTFETLDYDENGTITLAEYRVFKLMTAGTYKPSAIAEARK